MVEGDELFAGYGRYNFKTPYKGAFSKLNFESKNWDTQFKNINTLKLELSAKISNTLII